MNGNSIRVEEQAQNWEDREFRLGHVYVERASPKWGVQRAVLNANLPCVRASGLEIQCRESLYLAVSAAGT